jgi:hypothetical protein
VYNTQDTERNKIFHRAPLHMYSDSDRFNGRLGQARALPDAFTSHLFNYRASESCTCTEERKKVDDEAGSHQYSSARRVVAIGHLVNCVIQECPIRPNGIIPELNEKVLQI